MIRALPLVFVLAVSSPALAQGGPPPPEVQVWLDLPHFEGSVPAEIQAAAEASASLLGSIEDRPDQSGWFTPAPWPNSPFARDCYSGSTDEATACVRAAFQRSPEWTQPPVARAFVSVRPALDGALDWACTGIGAEPTNAEAQIVRFTPADWDNEAAFWQARRSAAACVMAAAAESGW
ncbi:MAG: hypothetical protein J0L52_00485 [Caulobacterales bacterium]|nr:hypothetical protein [Caulobacterales bacterium]